RRAITRATDPPWRPQEAHLVSLASIELFHTLRRLIHQHHWPGVAREPPRRPLLIAPREAAARALREFDVVRRVGGDDTVRLDPRPLHAALGDTPAGEPLTVRQEIPGLSNPGIPPDRHVKQPSWVKTAQAVETGAIEKVEQRGRFLGLTIASSQKRIESI